MASQNSQRLGTQRGVLWMGAAKIYFVITSYATQILLPRLLGSAESYGDFASVTNLALLLTNVLIVAVAQSLSRLVAQNEAQARSLFRQTLVFHLGLGVFLGLCFYLSSGWLARFILQDQSLERLLRPLSLVVCAYTLYPLCVGLLNGQQKFLAQAKLDIFLSSFRTLGFIAGAFFAVDALGPVWGLCAASGVTTLIGFYYVRKSFGAAPSAPYPLRLSKWLWLMAPLGIYYILVNALMQFDLTILKHQATKMWTMQGFAWPEAARQASQTVGYYRAAQTFAFIPYQLTVALAFVLYPKFAKLTNASLKEESGLVRQTFFISAVLLGFSATLISAYAAPLMRFIYPDDYVVGASALSILVWAQVALSLFTLVCTLLNATSRNLWANGLALLSLLCLITLGLNLVSQCNNATCALSAMAWATLGASTLAALVGLSWLIVKIADFKLCLALSLVTLISVICFALSRLLSYLAPDPWWLGFLIATAVYVLLLLLCERWIFSQLGFELGLWRKRFGEGSKIS